VITVTNTGQTIISQDSAGNDPAFPSGLGDAAIKTNAAIQATKLVQQRSFDYQQSPGGAVVAYTGNVHYVRGATGKVLDMNAVITDTIATGADRTVIVDLQKSTGAAAFATVCTTTITLNNVSTLRTAIAAVLNASLVSLVAGDILRIVATVAGAAGNQAIGLQVTITIQETPS
jgi:hypothetical protein